MMVPHLRHSTTIVQAPMIAPIQPRCVGGTWAQQHRRSRAGTGSGSQKPHVDGTDCPGQWGGKFWAASSSITCHLHPFVNGILSSQPSPSLSPSRAYRTAPDSLAMRVELELCYINTSVLFTGVWRRMGRRQKPRCWWKGSQLLGWEKGSQPFGLIMLYLSPHIAVLWSCDDLKTGRSWLTKRARLGIQSLQGVQRFELVRLVRSLQSLALISFTFFKYCSHALSESIFSTVWALCVCYCGVSDVLCNLCVQGSGRWKVGGHFGTDASRGTWLSDL